MPTRNLKSIYYNSYASKDKTVSQFSDVLITHFSTCTVMASSKTNETSRTTTS